MAFVRSWVSETLRAGVAVLLVPIALLATLAVFSIGNGTGGLSSLGELVVGPRLPEAGAAVAAVLGPKNKGVHRTSGVALPRIPATLAAPTSHARTAPATRRVSAPTSTTPVSRPRTPRTRPTPSPSRPPPPSRTPQTPQVTTTSSTPSPAPPPAQHSGPVTQLAGQVENVVRPLAGPVGESVANTIGAVTQLVAPTGL
jgi:hypothetical protein